MSYTGGVPVNAGFYPRSNFPIAEAKDIYVSEEKRLNSVLAELFEGIENASTQEHKHSTLDTVHDRTQITLSTLIETYMLAINYDTMLSFDTNEIVVDFSKNSSLLGKSILGNMILNKK